jgi:hypothetical protein
MKQQIFTNPIKQGSQAICITFEIPFLAKASGWTILINYSLCPGSQSCIINGGFLRKFEGANTRVKGGPRAAQHLCQHKHRKVSSNGPVSIELILNL